MTIPLITLGALSLVAGLIGIPHLIGEIIPGHPHNFLLDWMTPAIANLKWPHYSSVIEWSLMGISVGAAGVAAWLAYQGYILKPEALKHWVDKMRPLQKASENKYYVDEFYYGKIINPLIELSKGLWAYIDVNFIDKITYLVSDLIRSAGGGLRALQNGNLQQYALYIVMGVVASIVFMVVS